MLGSPGTSPASDVPSVAKVLSQPPWPTKTARFTAKDAMLKTSGPRALASGKERGPWSTLSELTGTRPPAHRCALFTIPFPAASATSRTPLSPPHVTSDWNLVSGSLWCGGLPERGPTPLRGSPCLGFATVTSRSPSGFNHGGTALSPPLPHRPLLLAATVTGQDPEPTS